MSARTLAVVAASGLAREALAVDGVLDGIDRVVVLDEDPEQWGGTLSGHPILDGGLARVLDFDAHVVVCAGSGAARRRIVNRLAGHGIAPDRFVSILHPSVCVPDGCSVGHGSILLANVVLTTDVRRHVVAMPNVTLTHDVVVEDYATLCAQVSLGGSVRVGEAAYLGMNSCVRERLRIGHDAVVGMGAAVVRDVPAGESWVGVPARCAGDQPDRSVRDSERVMAWPG